MAKSNLAGTLAVACFACGGQAALTVAPDASADAAPTPTIDAGTAISAALTVPVGAYAGCSISTVNIDGNTEATGGGDGTVTLAARGDGTISAVLSFDRWMNGTVALSPTSSTTAALMGGPFDVQTLDAAYTNVTVPASAGSLAIVGNTLFISVFGQSDATKLSAYGRCPVPASLPATTIVGSTLAGSIPSGTYSACTSSVGTSHTTVASGGDFSLTVAESGGTLTARWSAGYPRFCDFTFRDRSETTATLGDGQTCSVGAPCGPPPTLGPSSVPEQATLTDMVGSIAISAGVLFVNVTGDAPAQACGEHFLSLICPTGP
jgi:hypothetical protein